VRLAALRTAHERRLAAAALQLWRRAAAGLQARRARRAGCAARTRAPCLLHRRAVAAHMFTQCSLQGLPEPLSTPDWQISSCPSSESVHSCSACPALCGRPRPLQTRRGRRASRAARAGRRPRRTHSTPGRPRRGRRPTAARAPRWSARPPRLPPRLRAWRRRWRTWRAAGAPG